MNSGRLFADKTGNLSNKKLVIIELSGGNDGLNTLYHTPMILTIN